MTHIGTLAATMRPDVIGLVAAAALAVVAALSRAHGRRLERRMAAELGPRAEPFAAPLRGDAAWAVGAARTDSLRRRDPELRITLEELVEQRNELLSAFQQVQARIHEMRVEEERQQRVVRPEALPNVVVLRDRMSERDLVTERSASGRPQRSS